jgi:hypothetical protein
MLPLTREDPTQQLGELEEAARRAGPHVDRCAGWHTPMATGCLQTALSTPEIKTGTD